MIGVVARHMDDQIPDRDAATLGMDAKAVPLFWRDLPQEFGNWFTVYTRFWRWAQKGAWEWIFKRLSDDPGFEYVLVDATHIRVHQHGTGAKG